MRWTALVVAAAATVSGLAGPLNVGSGVQWYVASFPDIAGYIQQVNETIRFINNDVEGDVAVVGLLDGGPGVSISQSVGRTFALGAKLVMLKGGVGTDGAWHSGGSEHEVALSLEVGMIGGLAELTFGLADGLVEVSLAGGWGTAWVDHRCEFGLPGGWEMPFAPPPDDRRYRTGGPIGQLGVRAKLPLGPGLTLGTEGGLRLAPFGVPHAEGEMLDLAQDGVGDRLEFTGLWVGFTVVLSFDL